MIYSEWKTGLWDLQIIAFCFYLHFTKRPNFFGIGLVFFKSKRNWIYCTWNEIAFRNVNVLLLLGLATYIFHLIPFVTLQSNGREGGLYNIIYDCWMVREVYLPEHIILCVLANKVSVGWNIFKKGLHWLVREGPPILSHLGFLPPLTLLTTSNCPFILARRCHCLHILQYYNSFFLFFKEERHFFFQMTKRFRNGKKMNYLFHNLISLFSQKERRYYLPNLYKPASSV